MANYTLEHLEPQFVDSNTSRVYLTRSRTEHPALNDFDFRNKVDFPTTNWFLDQMLAGSVEDQTEQERRANSSNLCNHGHLAAAGNYQCINQKTGTFVLTNLVAQYERFNGETWAAVEEFIREELLRPKGRSFIYSDAWIATGPLFEGRCNEGTDLPTHFFKCTVFRLRGKGTTYFTHSVVASHTYTPFKDKDSTKKDLDEKVGINRPDLVTMKFNDLMNRIGINLFPGVAPTPRTQERLQELVNHDDIPQVDGNVDGPVDDSGTAIKDKGHKTKHQKPRFVAGWDMASVLEKFTDKVRIKMDKEHEYHDKQRRKHFARNEGKCVLCYKEPAVRECTSCKFSLWCVTCLEKARKEGKNDDLDCDECGSDNRELRPQSKRETSSPSSSRMSDRKRVRTETTSSSILATPTMSSSQVSVKTSPYSLRSRVPLRSPA